MALNRDFCAAGGSAETAEMPQMPRNVPVCPPRRKSTAAAADMRDNGAETAKGKCIFNTESQ